MSVEWTKEHHLEVQLALSHLLARIHRDGGHYQQKHGTLKAIQDGVERVIEMLTRMPK